MLAVRLIQPAPPSTLTIAAGPKGSSFWNSAQKYKAILARNRVTLNVLETQGSLDNLTRLSTTRSRTSTSASCRAASRAGRDARRSDVARQRRPMCRSRSSITAPTVTRLSELKGKRLAIGAEGSGTRALALALLEGERHRAGRRRPNCCRSPATKPPTRSIDGKVDAAFLTGDSAQPPMMGKLYPHAERALLSISRRPMPTRAAFRT